MTVRDLVSISDGSITAKVIRDCTIIAQFDSKYWKSINDDVLDMNVAGFECVAALMSPAGMLIYTEAPGEAHVKTQAELQAAMDDDSIATVILTDDIRAPEGTQYTLTLNSGQTKTVELNGNSIFGGKDLPGQSCAAINVEDGTLVINGDGDIFGGLGSYCNVAVWSDGENAKVIINGGRYNTELDSEGGKNNCIYASNKGSIVINAGDFRNDGTDKLGVTAQCGVLNLQDKTGSTIVCYGGTYKNQDPAAGDSGDPETGATFVGEGCKVTEETDGADTYYTVSEE